MSRVAVTRLNPIRSEPYPSTLVIATPEHRVGIVAELLARHFDVDEMQAAGDLLLLDASEMLATCMVDGMPHPERFNAGYYPRH